MPARRSAPIQLRAFVRLAFVTSWGIGGVGLLINWRFPGAHALGTASPLYYLAAYAVSLVGLLLTAYYTGHSGLRQLARRLVPRRSDAWAYLAVVVGYLMITGIATSTSSGLPTAVRLPWLVMLLQLPLTLLRDPGPVGEEFGWRGFALPRIVERYSLLSGAVVLGVIHTLWHAPLFFIASMPQAHVFFPTFAVGVIAIAVIDTFLYVRTESNLLLAILVHALANACGGVAKDADALNAFFLLEGLVAASIVASGALSTRAVMSQTPWRRPANER